MPDTKAPRTLTTWQRRHAEEMILFQNCLICQLHGRERQLCFDRISRIWLVQNCEHRPRLIVESVDGLRIVIEPKQDVAGWKEFVCFSKDIIDLTQRHNRFVSYCVGPDWWVWTLACTVFGAALAMMGVVVLAFLTGNGLKTAFLPFAFSPILLAIVMSVLLGGAPRHVEKAEMQSAINRLGKINRRG